MPVRLDSIVKEAPLPQGAIRLSSIAEIPADPVEVEQEAVKEFDVAQREGITYLEARKRLDNELVDAHIRQSLQSFKDPFEQDIITSSEMTTAERSEEVIKAVHRGVLSLAKTPGAMLKAYGESIPTAEQRAEWRKEHAAGEPRLLDKKLESAALFLREKSIKAGDAIIGYFNGIAQTQQPSERMKAVLRAPFLENPFTRAGFAVGESVPAYGIAVASTLMSKNPSLGLYILGTTTAAQTYESLRNENIDPDLALFGSVLCGSIEALTEKIPMERLLKGQGKRFLIRFMHQGTLESFQEFMANLGQNYVEEVVKDVNPKDRASWLKAAQQDWATITKGWEDAMAAGFLMGGGSVLPASLMQWDKPQRPKLDIETQITTPQDAFKQVIDNVKAQLAQNEAQRKKQQAQEKAEEIPPSSPLSESGAGSATPQIFEKNIGELPDRPVGMPKEKADVLKKSLQEKGFTEPIILNEDGTKVLDGLSRLEIAREIGIEKVPVIYINEASVLDENGRVDQSKIQSVRQSIPSQTQTIEAGGQPPVSSPPQVMEGEGKEVPSQLPLSVEARAIAENLNIEFGDLPTHRQMNMREQAQRAESFINAEPERAKRVALGLEPPPAGLYHGSIFVALETMARMKGDGNLLLELAKSKEAADLATAAGREVKAYDPVDKSASPVKAMREVIESRKEKQKERKQPIPTNDEIAALEKRVAELERKLEEKAAQTPPEQPKTPRPKTEYGAKNKLVKQSEYQAILERRKKQAAETPRRGKEGGFVYVPTAQDFQDLAKIALFHAEAIGRNFVEWSKRVVEDLGDWTKPYLEDEFKKAVDKLDDIAVDDIQKKMKKAIESGKNITELTRYAHQIAETFVRAGIVERNALIDAVHEVLKEIDPNITRRQAMDLISGYGQFSPLDKEEAKATLRDLKGQMQQLAKLEDIQAGIPPKKTGKERRTPSDEERALIKQVEEAKKKYGIETTDKETQLKSALDEVKTRLRNQITDLERQIETREKIVKEKTKLEYDAEANALKEKRDALKKQFDAIFGKPQMSDAQKLKMAIEAVKKSIADYERRIKQQDFSLRRKKSTLTSPELESLRMQRDALKEQYEHLKDLQKPKLSPEQIALNRLKRRIQTNTAKLEQLFESGHFEKPVRKHIELDEEGKKLHREWEAARDKLNAARQAKDGLTPEEAQKIADLAQDVAEKKERMLNSPRRESAGKPTQAEMEYGMAAVLYAEYVESLKAKKTLGEWIVGYLTDPLQFIFDAAGAARSIVASLDNSFIGRQGIKVFYKGITDWKSAEIWGRTFLGSFKTIWDTMGGKNTERALKAMIISDPDYDLIRKTKTDIATIEEEMPVNLGKIPVLGMPFRIAENAYLYSAHYMRYRLAKMYLDIWRNAGVDLNDKREIESIGRLVGSLTMRGKSEGTGQRPGWVNNLFFSPRGIKGDIDFLFLNFFNKNLSPFAKKQAAINLLRYITGLAAILFIADWIDDDSVTWDTRSTDFGKIKVGNSRFTIGGSIPVLVVLASRLLTGQTVNSITGEKKELNTGKFGQKEKMDLVYNFLENKLSPAASAAVELLNNRTRDDKEPTMGTMVYQLTTPLQIQTAFETMEVENSANLLSVIIAEFVGVGVQSYAPKEKTGEPISHKEWK